MFVNFNNICLKLFLNRYCQQVLCETVRSAKLTPVSARLQDTEGKIDQFIIPREVGKIWCINSFSYYSQLMWCVF
jgi:hypothetical protein